MCQESLSVSGNLVKDANFGTGKYSKLGRTLYSVDNIYEYKTERNQCHWVKSYAVDNFTSIKQRGTYVTVRHMSERFFRFNRPGYPHPVCSELENSGIIVAVGDCSVTERRRRRPPYQTGKTVHVQANTLQT